MNSQWLDRHRLWLNRTLPHTIVQRSSTTCFPIRRRSGSVDTEVDRRAANPISGGAETPVEVEGTKGLLCCNHRNLPPYIILLFDQPLLFAMQSWGCQIWREPHFDLWEKEMWTVLVAKWSFVNHQQMLITNRPWFANHLYNPTNIQCFSLFLAFTFLVVFDR